MLNRNDIANKIDIYKIKDNIETKTALVKVVKKRLRQNYH